MSAAATAPTYDAELLDALARVFAEAALERWIEDMKPAAEDKDMTQREDKGRKATE
jgi:hypothetical protein